VDAKHLLCGDEVIDVELLRQVCDIEGEFSAWSNVAIGEQGICWLPLSTRFNAPALLTPLDLPAALAAAQQAAATSGAKPVIRLDGKELLAKHGVTATDDGHLPTFSSGGGVIVAKEDQLAELLTLRTQYNKVLLTADPPVLTERLRWWPGAKTPSVGLRWGVGVYVAQQTAQPRFISEAHWGQFTSPVGPLLLRQLQERTTAGGFGDWSTADAKLSQIVLLGADKQATLMERGRAAGLDVLLMFLMEKKRIGLTNRYQTSLRLRVVDLNGKQPIWSSTTLTDKQLTAASDGGEEVVNAFAGELATFIDENMALKPMPTLTPQQAARRAASLAAASSENPWPALVELQYYFDSKLLSDDEATDAFGKVLGAARGRAWVKGNATIRRELLSNWEKSLSP
jgi:hypothetical protein